MRRNTFAEMTCQFFRAAQRAVDDGNAQETPLLQSVDNGTSGTACAQNQSRIRIVPIRCQRIQIGSKTIGIGIATAKLAVFEPERIDRANGLGRFIAASHSRKSHFLMRDRDITADKTALLKRGGKFYKIFGRDFDGFIGAFETQFLEPETVNEWRARMLYWKACDKCLLAIDQIFLPQFMEQRQQGQSDDGEIIAFDFLEKLDAWTFDLISADT